MPPTTHVSRPSSALLLRGAPLALGSALVLGSLVARAAVPGSDAPDSTGFSLSGYGELLLQTRFYGPDPNVDYASGDTTETDVDLARVVFFVGYDFTPRLRFQSEIEIEHGGTGAAMELEWDEFGEYELEVDKGGEIVLEQAFLEFAPTDALTLKVGHLLVPVGTLADYHQPLHFATVQRPEGETRLLPSTWHETGVELAWRWRGLGVRLQAVTGLDSTGFSSAGWISGGTQRRFERVLANDWAGVVQLEYSGVPGLLVGASGYLGDTLGNRPKRDMEGLTARLAIFDVHARYHVGPLRLRALGLFGWLDHADAITEKNASLSSRLEVPRTPVGAAAYALSLEATLDLLALASDAFDERLDLFVRAEAYDTMADPPAEGGLDNPLLERRVLTVGLGYLPHPRVILKAEFLSRWVNQNDAWDRHQLEFNAGLGFVL